MLVKNTLTRHDVARMRTLHEDEGYGYGTLAKMFGVVKATAQQVCTYRTWKGVPPLRIDYQRIDEIKARHEPVSKIKLKKSFEMR